LALFTQEIAMAAPEKQEATYTNKVTIEWKVLEDDEAWRMAQAALPQLSAPRSFGHRHWWIITAAALLLLVSAGAWLWQQARSGERHLKGELQIAAENDQWHRDQARQSDLRQGGLLPVAHSHSALQQLQTEVPDTEIVADGDGWAIVRVTLTQSALTYRQTRLYREGTRGWYAADPSADLWGAPHTLETAHFLFHYYALDGDAVAAAAAKLDAFYPDLAADYRLDRVQTGKVEIDVSPEVRWQMPVVVIPGEPLKYASPSLYLAPANISEGDILAQAILLNLLPRFAGQSSAAGLFAPSQDVQAQARVRAFLPALGLWQLWHTGLPLAALHKPAIQWLYSDAPRGQRHLPALRADLCPLHDLWRSAPYLLRLPLFCGDALQLRQFAVNYFVNASPRTMAEIHINPRQLPDEPDRGVNLTQAEIGGLATVIDYAAATYGRPAIPRLLANAADDPGWEKLIPATFGVPASEFEAGWQAYLRDHYQLATP
jgi:hypothetical protein